MTVILWRHFLWLTYLLNDILWRFPSWWWWWRSRSKLGSPNLMVLGSSLLVGISLWGCELCGQFFRPLDWLENGFGSLGQRWRRGLMWRSNQHSLLKYLLWNPSVSIAQMNYWRFGYPEVIRLTWIVCWLELFHGMLFVSPLLIDFVLFGALYGLKL